mmetsp:Transcript_5352/g.17577  ORF Transcript_5352/g.17577 Transcript_5352/m.17577 type:complete len:459 (-) Transcript_5352:58-1434(-)
MARLASDDDPGTSSSSTPRSSSKSTSSDDVFFEVKDPCKQWSSSLAIGSFHGKVKICDPFEAPPETVLRLQQHPCSVWSLVSLTLPCGEARLVSGADDGLVRIFDPIASAFPVATLVGHADAVAAVDAAGGAVPLIASASFDKTVRVWEYAEKRKHRHSVLRGHDDYVIAVACVQETAGSLVVSGSRDATVIVWDVDARAPAQRLDGHSNHVFSVVVFRGFGEAAAAAAPWSSSSSAYSSSSSSSSGGSSHNTAETTSDISPPGASSWRVASASGDRTIRFWTGGRTSATLEGHRHAVTVVRAIEPDDQQARLVSGSKDATLRLWSSSGDCLATFRGHSGAVHALECFTLGRDTPRIASGSVDNTVRIWDPRRIAGTTAGKSSRKKTWSSSSSAALLLVIRAHSSAITAMAFIPTSPKETPPVDPDLLFPNLVLDDSPSLRRPSASVVAVPRRSESLL